jgi:aspartate aminotransferase
LTGPGTIPAMPGIEVSDRIRRLQALVVPLFEFFVHNQELRAALAGDFSDFMAGNPQEMASEEYVETLRRWSMPRSPDWFAYKESIPQARAAAAASLRERLGIPFEDDDLCMTNAAIAALAVAIRTVADVGDEVVIVRPPHFLYEPLIMAVGARAVRVDVDHETFDLDVDAISGVMSERTRAIIVNTPHNPTGKVFPAATLERLASVLEKASKRWRTVYLLSDEAYNRVVFDGRRFESPAAFYPNTMLIYSYGKQLLAPSERIGYIALPPTMPGRKEMRMALVTAQLATGYAFPNGVLQYALADLERISVDMDVLQRRRDEMVEGLREIGYELHVPEAAFYLLIRSPIPDDRRFTDMLAEERILVMPGSMLEAPGYFRISLTASDEMIERSIPGFARAMKRAGDS